MIVRSSKESSLLPGFAWCANRDLANDLLIRAACSYAPGGFETTAYLCELSLFLAVRFDLWNTNWNTRLLIWCNERDGE